MFTTKFGIGLATPLAVVLCGAAVSTWRIEPAGAAETADVPLDLSSIDQRVRDWELSDEERRFDEIGWAGGLCEAERLSRKLNRPLFVFTYSGSATEANAIALRRC